MEYNVKYEIGDLALYPSKIHEEMRLLKIKGFKQEEGEFYCLAKSNDDFNDDVFYKEDEIISMDEIQPSHFFSVYFSDKIEKLKKFLEKHRQDFTVDFLYEIEQEIISLEEKCKTAEFSNQKTKSQG